jgi:hypothetical protein
MDEESDSAAEADEEGTRAGPDSEDDEDEVRNAS